MGVNLAGAEFGDQLPGVYDKQYTYTPAQSLDYYAAQKRTVIRLPFKWERVQRSPGAPLMPMKSGACAAFCARRANVKST